MKRSGRERRRRLTAEDVPALAEFARAYLHEDVFVEHGSAESAVRQYVRDASARDIAGLRHDLRRLADCARSWGDERLERFFVQEMRSSWTPKGLPEVESLLRATEH